MPKTKPNKVLNLICPHESCHESFAVPLIEKGILFCPHCNHSLLTEKPVDVDQINKVSIVENRKSKSLLHHWPYFAWLSLYAILLIMAKIYSWTDIMDLYLIAIFLVGSIIFERYKSHYNSVLYRLKHNEVEFKAGVDTLSNINKFSEINTDYVNNEGVLNHSKCRFNKVEMPVLKNCPHCKSQMVVKLQQMVDWQKNLYSKYDIYRPKGVPDSEYCSVTKRYVSRDTTLSNIFLCLNCHTHYSWLYISNEHSTIDEEDARQLCKM